MGSRRLLPCCKNDTVTWPRLRVAHCFIVCIFRPPLQQLV